MTSETVAERNEVGLAVVDAAAVGSTISPESLVESGINNNSIGEGGGQQTAAASSSKDIDGVAILSEGGESKTNRDRALPKLKPASNLPSRLHIPQAGKSSPPSSRNSSISGKSSPSRFQRERGSSLGSPGRGLIESFEASLGERTDHAGGKRVIVSASSGTNLRAISSPSSSASSRRARRDERGKSMPTQGTRGLRSEARSSLSNRTSPRASQSPDTKSSMSFGDFVAASNTELSLLESSRLSASGKRPRDRNALRVAVRVRPLIERETGSRAVACDGGDGRMVVVNPIKFKASADAVLATASAVSRANMATADWLRPFDFDRVFWSTPSQTKGGSEEACSASERATQQSVFEGLGERIVQDVLNGFNCSCFAYGHTGSGKTYSMFGCTDKTSLPGAHEALAAPPEGEAFGLVPRICYSLLHRLQEASSVVPPQEPGMSSVGLSVQFIEIYNDKIRDLLHPGADSKAFRVREHPQTGPYVDNLVPVQVESWSQLRQLLALGTSARTEADTPENSKSSRGHAILTLEAQTPTGLSRVQMVDLAGSEREVVANDRSSDPRRRHEQGGDADGRTPSQRLTLSQRLRETAQIKKALSNLGIIIKGLSRGDTPVGLPFRDSILTWLLKEALSGRAHTTMLATVSPSSNSYVETMNTLKYAERLKRASAHLSKDSGGQRIAKPSDGMKKEMKSLVEMLGADGIEARRQVLYQTVSDPQQRIAKLTAKDPRRRRTSSGGGSSFPIGDHRSDDEDKSGQRRTSFPGSVSSPRFGWSPATASRPADKTSDLANDSATAWGSPIVAAGDVSTGGYVDKALQEERNGAGAGVGSSDDGTGKPISEHEGIESAGVPLDGPEGAAFAGQSDTKLYSETDSEGGEDGNAGNGAVQKGGNYDGGGGSDRCDRGGGDDSDSGLGGDDTSAHEGEVSMAPLDGGDDDAQSTAVDDQHPDLQPPDTGPAPNWAGTISSDEQESPDSARTEASAYETAVDTSTNNQVDDAATVPTYPAAPVQGGAAPETPGAFVRGSSETFFRESPHTSVTGSTAVRTGEMEVGISGETFGKEVARSTAVVQAKEGADSWGKPDGSVLGPTAESLREVPDAGQHTETIATGPAIAERGEVPDSAFQVGMVDDTITSSAPSRRITWAADETRTPAGPRRGEERKVEEGNAPSSPFAPRKSRKPSSSSAAYTTDAPPFPMTVDPAAPAVAHRAAESRASFIAPRRGGVSHRHTLGTESLKHCDDQAEERLPVDPGPNNQRCMYEGGDSLVRETLNSSVESGGGAAALAASGVFDVTGTSAELEESVEGGVSTGDVDSLEEVGVQGQTWAQQHPVRDEEGRRAVEGRSGEMRSSDDTNGLVEDLMRQIEQLKASNASLAGEVQRLNEELSKSKESEEEAWALGNDTAKEFQTRLASVQRDLEEQTSRAREAERSARDADARAENVLASGGDASRLLDDARKRMGEAEERASRAEGREEELIARANDACAQLDTSQAALEEQAATASGVQRLLDETRRRVEEAQQRAEQAEAKEELTSLANEGSQATLAQQGTVVEETRRLLEECRKQAKEAEQRAAQAEAREAEVESRAKDERARLSGLQAATQEVERMLDDARKQTKEAEERAAGAEAREEDFAARENDARTRLEDSEMALKDQMIATEEAEKMVDESRRQAEEAEERAAGAESRGKELERLANEVRAQLEASKTAFRDQMAMTEGAERKARQALAALEATSSDVDTAVSASQRTAEQERQRAAEAELKANRAVAKANELLPLVDEQETRLTKIRAKLDEERARADGAEIRERRAVARAEELAGVVDENEKRLAKVTQALQAEGARADEIAEGKDVAEVRVRELERETERQTREVEESKRMAKTALRACRTAAEAEVDQATQQRTAVLEERDRNLEQVEVERTEVLRLAAELNDLRAEAEQDAVAAREREGALKALLASETEASRAEQVEVEDLLSLISAAQDAGGPGRDTEELAATSISGARVAIEAQRAKYEATRRRLQFLEDDNCALRRSEAEAQARLDQLGLLEEERDFLLQEKDTLVDRLGNLEARQGSFQEREKQAKNREGEAALARENLEEELQGVKQRLAREVKLRAKEGKEFVDRLKEKDEEAAEQLSETLKQVMQGVKSQAAHIRDTVSQLEDERDKAIGGKDAATKELEDVKCQLEELKKEKDEARSNFDEQMKQSARERAALWLAVNKLDVMEAAKDAAIKDLQTEGENKARALKVLQAHNAGLTRELGQVDLSLMEALEDHGLALDRVSPQNTPMARWLGRRRPTSRERNGITNGIASGNPSAEPEVVDMQPSENIGNGEDPVAGNVRRVRASAIAGALGRYDEASWPQSASRADGGGQGSVPGPPKPRNHSRLVGRLQHQNHETRAREHLAQAGERERMDHDLDGRVEGDPGVGVYTA
ncbi:unnamed protein product, partial [Pylaiella littoralis]